MTRFPHYARWTLALPAAAVALGWLLAQVWPPGVWGWW